MNMNKIDFVTLSPVKSPKRKSLSKKGLKREGSSRRSVARPDEESSTGSEEDDWSHFDEEESDYYSDDSYDSDDHTLDSEALIAELMGTKQSAGMKEVPSMLSLNAIKQLKSQTIGEAPVKQTVRRSLSAPNNMVNGMVTIAQMASAQAQNVGSGAIAEEDGDKPLKPCDYLTELLESKGYDATLVPSATLDDFFVPMTEEHIAAYELDVVAAFRQKDLTAIKKFHEQGKLVFCCNKYHESTVHLTCRRGACKILKFLTSEVNVSVRVRCDSGRTPLHDACWTSMPNFNLVKLLITLCPELLLISDHRKFSPLAYIPKNLWPVWNDFLKENQDLLVPNFP